MDTSRKLLTAALALLTVFAVALGLGPQQAGASSHREAPLISHDPAADNTDLYAFVSPDRAEHGHVRRQLHPARGAGRRPELQRVRRQRAVRNQRRQRRRRRGRHQLPVPLQDRDRATRTPSSTTPARSPRSTDPNWNMPPVLQRHARRERRADHSARPRI